jgi:hypothetical protein
MNYSILFESIVFVNRVDDGRPVNTLRRYQSISLLLAPIFSISFRSMISYILPRYTLNHRHSSMCIRRVTRHRPSLGKEELLLRLSCAQLHVVELQELSELFVVRLVFAIADVHTGHPVRSISVAKM